jgi:dipeptidyl aminopeptidase/acylaminoacyl peptidase
MSKNLFSAMLTVVFAAMMTATALAQSRPEAATTRDGEVVERNRYVFPSYEQALQSTNVKRYASQQDYEQAVNDPGFELQKLKYLSDGLKVVAYLYLPKKMEGKSLPAIIFNRPSAIRGDIAPELVHFFHGLAAEGFVILAPMYRQSDGGEGHDEMGGADLNDLMNVVPLAKSLGFVDMKNLFLYGASRGGIMTHMALKRNFPANAAVVFGATTDLEATIAAQPQIYTPAMLKQFMSDLDTRKDELLKARSAIHWPELLGAPLLIMHGGSDRDVSASQSLALAERLQKLGKTYELIVYAQDNHSLSRNQDDRDRRAIAWFKKHQKN